MDNITEYIGYAASVFVLISFVMKKMMHLRLINIIGCGLFIWYGAQLSSFPIIVTNAAIVLVNIFYIVKMRMASE